MQPLRGIDPAKVMIFDESETIDRTALRDAFARGHAAPDQELRYDLQPYELPDSPPVAGEVNSLLTPYPYLCAAVSEELETVRNAEVEARTARRFPGLAELGAGWLTSITALSTAVIATSTAPCSVKFSREQLDLLRSKAVERESGDLWPPR
jgi:hypothetical protein